MLKKLANCSFFEHEVDSNFNDIFRIILKMKGFSQLAHLLQTFS